MLGKQYIILKCQFYTTTLRKFLFHTEINILFPTLLGHMHTYVNLKQCSVLLMPPPPSPVPPLTKIVTMGQPVAQWLVIGVPHGPTTQFESRTQLPEKCEYPNLKRRERWKIRDYRVTMPHDHDTFFFCLCNLFPVSTHPFWQITKKKKKSQ